MNWKKIAAKRLAEIRDLKRISEYRREHCKKLLMEQMTTMFATHCYPRSMYESRVDEMADAISKRLY